MLDPAKMGTIDHFNMYSVGEVENLSVNKTKITVHVKNDLTLRFG